MNTAATGYPPIRRALLVLAPASGLVVGLALWVHSIGGPDVFSARYGRVAPLVSLPVHVIMSLFAIGEVIPVAAANGTAYGLWLGSAMNWIAWMIVAVLQHSFGRYALGGVSERRPLPRWFARLPIRHPVVLTCARWLPGGAPAVNIAAGVAGISLARTMLFAATGHLPQAFVLAGIGAGVLFLLNP